MWRRESGYGRQEAPRFHVVAVDYGMKRNILRMLAEYGCRVTVVPATATSEDILRHFCTRLIWMREGQIAADGPVDDVLAAYRASLAAPSSPPA